jgi:hypothetical protein
VSCLELEVAAVGDHLELLVGAGAACVLDELGPVGVRSAHHIKTFSAVPADDAPVPAAGILELPLLPGIATVGVLADARAVVGVR